MSKNIEIKARIESVELLLPLVAKIADKGPTEIIQNDTFFSCPNGRLKLRTFSKREGQLIFYKRPDISAPKESFYIISPTASPDTLREMLTLAYGECGHIHKHRVVFMAGRTRVHLDKVERLGDFLELEVVLEEGEPIETGVSVAHELLEKIAVSHHQLIEESYIDLLAKLPNKAPESAIFVRSSG